MAKATSYLGKVPKQGARLPAGLPRTLADATRKMSGGKPRASRAASPRVNLGAANAGFGAPPAGGGSGIPKATSSMAAAPRKVINKPKVGRPANTRTAARPKADITSRI